MLLLRRSNHLQLSAVLVLIVCIGLTTATRGDRTAQCSTADNVQWLDIAAVNGSGCNTTAKSVTACCSQCYAHPKCLSWTFHRHDAATCPGACFLWTSVPKATNAQAAINITSGIIGGVAQLPQPMQDNGSAAVNGLPGTDDGSRADSAAMQQDQAMPDSQTEVDSWASVGKGSLGNELDIGNMTDIEVEDLEDWMDEEDDDEWEGLQDGAALNGTITKLARRWKRASGTWYGPGDQTGSIDPISANGVIGQGWGSCLQNFRWQLSDDLLAKYAQFYAAVNDHGPLYGWDYCAEGNDPRYPWCNNQQNCGRCYRVKCIRPCLRDPSCSSWCTGNSVVVYMVDACPARSTLQQELQQKYGFNGCVDAAERGTNHFDISRQALDTIVQGGSGELLLGWRRVPC